MIPRRFFSLALLLFCSCFGKQILAEHDLQPHAISLSGFATIGLVKGGDEDLGFTRDLTHKGVFDEKLAFKQDTVFGLQMDSHLSSSFNATLQFVLRDRPEDTFSDSIEWAFLRYQTNEELSFRVGRTVVDLFTLSDYRNVGFAYLWVRPPIEFYGPVAINHVDGFDVSYAKNLSGGYFELKLFAGTAENDLASGDNAEEFEIDPIYGVNATWEYGNWKSRVGLASFKLISQSSVIQQLSDALAQVPPTIWPEAADLSSDIQTEGQRFNYFSLGLSYDNTPWILESELGFIDSEYRFFTDVFNAYVSLGYRHNQFTYYSLLAYAKNSGDRVQVTPPQDPPISPDPANPVYGLYLGTQAVADANTLDQTTISIGTRWDIAPNVALKAQLDHHQVKAFGSYLWSIHEPLTEDKSLNTFSINVNLLF